MTFAEHQGGPGPGIEPGSGDPQSPRISPTPTRPSVPLIIPYILTISLITGIVPHRKRINNNLDSLYVLTLNIIDAELELVPESMWDDYQIRKVAKNLGKKYNEMLLDSNYMHGAIERYLPGMSNRMGRPDIFHTLLNVTQDSILNKKGHLNVNIHTKHNSIIRVSPETRIPKSYNRFAGLFEKLLTRGDLKSPDGKTLISIGEGRFEDLLRGDGTDILMSPKGEIAKMNEVVKFKDMNVFIGGFSEGDFKSHVYERLKAFSIFDEELTIWTVGWEIMSSYERMIGLL